MKLGRTRLSFNTVIYTVTFQDKRKLNNYKIVNDALERTQMLLFGTNTASSIWFFVHSILHRDNRTCQNTFQESTLFGGRARNLLKQASCLFESRYGSRIWQLVQVTHKLQNKIMEYPSLHRMWYIPCINSVIKWSSWDESVSVCHFVFWWWNVWKVALLMNS